MRDPICATPNRRMMLPSLRRAQGAARRRSGRWCAALALLSVCATGAAMYAVPSVYPTGTTIYDPSRAWSGYTVFVLPDTGAVLIDMNGKTVREWTQFEGASG